MTTHAHRSIFISILIAGLMLVAASPARATAAANQDADPAAIAQKLANDWQAVRGFNVRMIGETSGLISRNITKMTVQATYSVSPAGWRYKLSGAVEDNPAMEDNRLDIARDALGRYTWLDHLGNRVLNGRTLPPQMRVYQKYFESDYFYPLDAFETFAAGTLTHDGTEEIDGELCDIIGSQVSDNDSRQVWIARSDGLPRKVVGSIPIVGSFFLTFEDFDVLGEVNPSDLEIETPRGYTEGVDARRDPAEPTQPAQAFRKRFDINVADWQLPSGDGGMVKLRELKDRAVVLNFWGTWNTKSEEATKIMESLHQRYTDNQQPVNVYGVAVRERDPNAAIAYFEANGLTYPLLLEGDDLARDYKVRQYPTFVILDRGGDIVDIIVGIDDNIMTDLGRAVNEALTREVIDQ